MSRPSQKHVPAVGILPRLPRRRVVDAAQAAQVLLERGLDLGDLLQLREVQPDAVEGGQALGCLDHVLDLAAVEVVLGERGEAGLADVHAAGDHVAEVPPDLLARLKLRSV